MSGEHCCTEFSITCLCPRFWDTPRVPLEPRSNCMRVAQEKSLFVVSVPGSRFGRGRRQPVFPALKLEWRRKAALLFAIQGVGGRTEPWASEVLRLPPLSASQERVSRISGEMGSPQPTHNNFSNIMAFLTFRSRFNVERLSKDPEHYS